MNDEFNELLPKLELADLPCLSLILFPFILAIGIIKLFFKIIIRK